MPVLISTWHCVHMCLILLVCGSGGGGGGGACTILCVCVCNYALYDYVYECFPFVYVPLICTWEFACFLFFFN